MSLEKPEIQVRYFGDQAPTVILPKELENRVKVVVTGMRDQEGPVFEYKGVSVYKAVISKRGGAVAYSAHWLAPMPSVDFENEIAFDLRRVTPVPAAERAAYERRFPGDDTNQRLAYAIDRGYLTPHGYLVP